MKRHSTLEHKKKLKERYDKEYVFYDKTRSSWMLGYLGSVEQRVILSFLKKDSVLEIGTGTGRYAALLKNRNYVGIDLSSKMLSRAKKRSSDSLICADAENLPFREGTFNNVICSRTFRFIPNPLKALKETCRVLKKEGSCIVSVDFLKDFYGYKVAHFVFKGYSYETHYHIKEIRDLFRKAGLQIVHQEILFNFPETFYQKIPHSLWRPVEKADSILKKWVKGWFLITVGKTI